MRHALGVLLVALAAALPAWAADGSIGGRIVDPDGLPVPGVSITIVALTGGPTRTATTDSDGRYQAAVPTGHYRIRAELGGFQPAERPDVVVSGVSGVSGALERTTVDLVLALASVQEQVTVSADAPHALMGNPRPDAPVLVTREVFDAAMLPNSQYDDVLPLMPNVVRAPDGSISVAGARAPQGALVVNGIDHTDPISGAPAILMPLEAVDSMQVYSGGYPAEHGRATGGVTAVETRSGADRFQWSANSFFPRLLLEDGGIHGVEYWDPNAGISGPIVKGRAYFEQAISYRYDRNRYDTLVGPQASKYNALMSWSQVDLEVSPRQHALVTISADPQHTDRANITAFTPADSVPEVEQGGWSAGLADRVAFGSTATLELRASTIRSHLATTPYGAAPYQVGHDLVAGSYFDEQDLRGQRFEAGASLSWNPAARHTVKAGATIGRDALDGGDQSHQVELLQTSGHTAQSIGFLGGGALHASTGEIVLFVQDSWAATPRLTIDSGVRYDQTLAAGSPVVGPRVAGTYKAPGGRTGISGSVGLYADKLLLGTLAFTQLPDRLVQSFDASGAASAPVVYHNVLADALPLPRAARWDVELTHDFASGWLARVKYQERRGWDEPIVDPIVTSPAAGVLTLQGTGRSQSRSLEATAGYRARGKDEIYASYVRSATFGDGNAFDSVMGAFREPFIQANSSGPLPADVPHRLLTWGVFHAPARITIAPFVEVRSGFPYSAVADDWTYVGQRNGARLPWFGSMDLYVNKIVGLPHRLPDARVGLKLYNLASVHTERDVQRDVQRTDFGTTYNPIPRDFTMVFELLWGRH